MPDALLSGASSRLSRSWGATVTDSSTLCVPIKDSLSSPDDHGSQTALVPLTRLMAKVKLTLNNDSQRVGKSIIQLNVRVLVALLRRAGSISTLEAQVSVFSPRI